MSAGQAWIAALLMLLVAVAGCSETSGTDETPGEGQPGDAGQRDDPTPSDGDDPEGHGGDGTGNGTATNTAPEILAFEADRTEGEAPFDVRFDGNATDSDGDAMSWALDADGDGSPEAEGQELPFNLTYTYDAAGTFNATLTVSDGAQESNQTVLIAVRAVDASGLPPEGGQVESTTAGASAQAAIGRTPFTIEGDHARLDITTYLEDPLASVGGETYTVRLTPPSGGDDDHTVEYGETITISDPEVGTWEIGIFPSGAGAYDWTADWCAYTSQTC